MKRLFLKKVLQLTKKFQFLIRFLQLSYAASANKQYTDRAELLKDRCLLLQ